MKEKSSVVIITVFAFDLTGGVTRFDFVGSISTFVSVSVATIGVLGIDVSQNRDGSRGFLRLLFIKSQIEIESCQLSIAQ